MSHTAWVLIAAAVMLPGLAGVVLPVLPGIPLMFVVALVFGYADGFQHLRVIELLGLLLLVLLSVGVDYFSGLLGARYGGASRWAMAAGFAGFLLGTVLLPPFGGIIGMFVAVILAEIAQRRDHRQAFRSAAGSVLGTVAGIGISLVIALLFIVLFIVFAWR